MTDTEAARLRLDKWLWHARVVKTRTLAARLVSEGHVRVNGTRVDTPAKAVKPGDVLTIALERTVRVYRVLALGARRGPAPEAQALYEDLAPAEPAPPPSPAVGGRLPGEGRPTKRERRSLDRFLGEDED